MNNIINNILPIKSIKHPSLWETRPLDPLTIGKKGLVGLLVGLLLCSCNDESNPYEPASPVSADCIGAYFPSSNSTEIIKADTDEKNFDITVKREKTDNAVSIPIEVVSKTDNITVPSTVNFEAGEEETTLTLSYSDLETTPKFDIKLDEAYVNPYKIKDGSMEFAGNVFRLNLISDKVVCTDYNAESGQTTIFKGDTTAIYQMGNENKFIWRNFLGSGIDLKFKIDGFNSEDVYQSAGSVIPLDHFWDDGAYGWYFMRSEAGDDGYCADWTTENGVVENYVYFYYEYEGTSYFYIDLTPTTSAKTGNKYGWAYIWPAYIDSWSTMDYSNFFIYY